MGERYFLLFDVTALIGAPLDKPHEYIMFEVSQYDSYSYLFTQADLHQPGSELPSGHRFRSRACASAINGAEAQNGQAYANLDLNVTDAELLAGQRASCCRRSAR